MPRVQCIVVRGCRVLMVLHRHVHDAWWTLPGGGQEPGETPAEGALRELREECNVEGTLLRQTSHVAPGSDAETYTYLVDIGDQDPTLGHDPEAAGRHDVLDGLRWLRLNEISERDRVYLWAAGLLGVGDFLSEVTRWGARISYPR